MTIIDRLPIKTGNLLITNIAVDTVEELYDLARAKQSVYSFIWGIKSAAWIINMSAMVINARLKSSDLFVVYNIKNIATKQLK